MKGLKWFSGVLFAGLALTGCSNNEEAVTSGETEVAALRGLLVKDGAPIGYVDSNGPEKVSMLVLDLPEEVQIGSEELAAFFEAQVLDVIPKATFKKDETSVSYILPEGAGSVSLKFANPDGTADEKGVYASIQVKVPAITEVSQIVICNPGLNAGFTGFEDGELDNLYDKGM